MTATPGEWIAELERANADLQARVDAAVEVLGVINASQGNLTPVFDAMLDRAMRLCRVAFGVLYTWDGTRRHAVATRGLPPGYAAFLAEEPSETTAPPLTLRMVETGRPLHVPDAMEGPGYRAGHPGPRAMVELGGARTMLLVPLRQDETVVGYFSLYRQEVRAFADREDAVMVRVRDNGTGMPDAVKARVFEPFFTTKPAGEGTGLGLSLSHDIVVKQHDGTIAVASEAGVFTEFTVILPRGAA